MERKAGKYRMGDSVSHFSGNGDFKFLTFDISNNKVLANVGVQGTLSNLTIYRDSYFSNPGRLPGVWVQKDFSTAGPYSYSLQIDGQWHDLATVDWDFRTGLLDNLIPTTELREPGGRLVARLLTYAPLSHDGSQRVRGLIYGLELENVSDRGQEGLIRLPWDPREFEIAIGDSRPFQREMPFHLGRGESIWVPTILYMLGDPVVEEVNQRGSVAWLRESWQYYRGLLGRLSVPGDPYLAEFFERQAMQALQSIAMSASGKLAGSNWGSYPATRQIWLKDYYYSCLPVLLLDPSLATKIILWFDEFGVRPKGNIVEGGVSHSLSLSVASIVLAGLYYEHTGDRTFFDRHPGLRDKWDRLLQEMIASRPDKNIWLFPSAYISDGRLVGDYHTGTNVVAWRALDAYSRLLQDVYRDSRRAREHAETADKVRAAILSMTVIDGPFGKQFIEAVNHDGKPPLMLSDGEESDTTLMPFYGFLPYDNDIYRNYMHFSMSEHNKFHQPKTYSIAWSGSPLTPLEKCLPSTAPGYMKGIAYGADRESLFGEHGYYTEVRKVTEADGSLWWWTYGRGGTGWSYGKVIRLGSPGKSGWFAGVHSAVFLSRFLGVSYDAPKRTLRFAPFFPSSDSFSWADFPLGGDRFSLSYEHGGDAATAKFTNHAQHPVQIEAILPPDGSRRVATAAPGATVTLSH